METDLLKEQNSTLINKNESSKEGYCSNLPEKITWTNTIRCNIGCGMCPIDRSTVITQPDLPLRNLQQIAPVFFPTLKTLNLTRRGEMFIDPHLQDIIDICRDYNVLVDINTNGIGMTDKWIRKNILQMADVKVSIDSVYNDIFNKIRNGASLGTVINNVLNYVRIRYDFDVKEKSVIAFSCTIMKRNIKQIPHVIKLAREIDVDLVKAYHMFVFRPDHENQSMMKYKEEYNKTYYECKDLAHDLGINVKMALPFLIDGNPPKLEERPCPRLWRRLWIDVNGDIIPCHHPCRRVLGNIFKDNLLDIWNSKEYQMLRLGKDPMCNKCGWMKISDRKSQIPYDDEFFLKTYEIYKKYREGLPVEEKAIGADWDVLWSRRTAQMPPHHI